MGIECECKPLLFLHAACSAQVKAKIPNPKDLEGKLAHGGAHSQVFFKTNKKLVDDKGHDKVFYKSLKLLTTN